jgi:hypothetical protein
MVMTLVRNERDPRFGLLSRDERGGSGVCADCRGFLVVYIFGGNPEDVLGLNLEDLSVLPFSLRVQRGQDEPFKKCV